MIREKYKTGTRAVKEQHIGKSHINHKSMLCTIIGKQ